MKNKILVLITFIWVCFVGCGANEDEKANPLDILEGEWTLNGTYPQGSFRGSWKIGVQGKTLEIAEWSARKDIPKTWEPIVLDSLRMNGDTLQFRLQRELLGSWISEYYHIGLNGTDQFSGRIRVVDEFLNDKGLASTEALLGESLGHLSTYSGTFTIKRK